jgi:hypothetical protein
MLAALLGLYNMSIILPIIVTLLLFSYFFPCVKDLVLLIRGGVVRRIGGPICSVVSLHDVIFNESN